MSRLPSLLAPGKFARHVVTLAGATALSQVALLATGPLLSRLYQPASWGVYSLVLAFVAVASVVTALCYDQAIVGAETRPEAAALTLASLVLGPVVTLFAVGAMALLISENWLGFGILPWSALGWAAALLLLMQVFVSFRYWHMREERFALLGRTAVTQNLGRAIFPVATVWPWPGGTGLLAGEALGRTIGILPLIRERWQETVAAYRSVTRPQVVAVLKRYAVFAYAGVPGGLLDAAALALPLPLIASAFGAQAAGEFALAQRVLQAPAALVGRSVADAFHARLAIHARERHSYLPRFFGRTALLLLAVAALPALVVLGLGASGFAWIFGAQWAVAGTFATMMLPWATGQLIVSPLSRAVFVVGGQRGKLVYDVVAVLLVLGTYAWARRAGWTADRTVLWLSLGQAAAYGVYFVILWRLIRRM